MGILLVMGSGGVIVAVAGVRDEEGAADDEGSHVVRQPSVGR